MIDILNKHFQDSLHINKEQSGLVQFANYLAYFLMAIPAGLIARKFGYKGGILVGLVLIASGAFWFIHAVSIGTYSAFLLGLFVIAAGMTCLETIANPYTTVLGPPEMARRASTSPRRSTAWAGFSARSSADISFSGRRSAMRAMPRRMPTSRHQCRACAATHQCQCRPVHSLPGHRHFRGAVARHFHFAAGAGFACRG